MADNVLFYDFASWDSQGPESKAGSYGLLIVQTIAVIVSSLIQLGADLVCYFASHPWVHAYITLYLLCKFRDLIIYYRARETMSTVLQPLMVFRELRVFHPRNITVAGKHYATVKNGVHGFMRTRGFHTRFTPTLDVFKRTITVATIFGFNVNCEIDVERVDDEHVMVRASEWSYFGCYHEPNLIFVCGEVAALGYMNQTEARVQLQAAPYVGCDLLLSEYEELRFRTGSKPNMGYMEFISKNLRVSREDIPRIAQALKEELRIVKFEPWVEPIVVGGDGDVEVSLLKEETDVVLDRVRPLGKILPQPYNQESVVFEANRSAENITFSDRIAKYVKTSTFKVPERYENYLHEFITKLVGESGNSLALDDLEVVLERQKRASQVQGYEDMKDLPDPLHVQRDAVFQKNEVYPEIKAPRNIVNPSHTKRVLTSSLVGPLADFLKHGPLKHIYGFGDADYIDECFQKVDDQDEGEGKYESDGTKMDANISSFFRNLELVLCIALFHTSYHDRVRSILKAQYEDNIPKSKKGNVVELHYSRRSGEGGTSIFNTLAMVFVFYCWLRELGYSLERAFDNLGVYGGDDGLTKAHGTVESLVKVGDDLGLPLKVKHVSKSEPYSFLGLTKMPGIDLYSPDVVRFCSKIAYSHVKGVPVEQVLYRKCEPYVRLYPNVPLIGNLCRAVLRILDSQGFKIDSRYDELCRSGKGYVMEMLQGTQLPGPTTSDEYYLLEHYVADTLGLPLMQLRLVCEQYDIATEFSQFPTGYIDKKNMLLDCPYEALIRDLYIQGPPCSKLENPLPTEALSQPAVQNFQSKNVQEEKQEEPDSESQRTQSSRQSDNSDSSSETKKKKRWYKGRKTKA